MRETITDSAGVLRYADSGRKVRRDKGTRKPHPPGCRHCDMVESYRIQRETEIRLYETVEHMDSGKRPVTFKEWLCAYRYETPEDYAYAA